MNLKITMFATLALAVLALGLFSSSQSVLAFGECQKVRGTLSAVNNGNSATGVITLGGKLNGTTLAVHTSGFTPTPDPTTVSFTDDLSVTTDKGVLITHNVVIFDVARGLFTAIARIDPVASTGDFARTTGVLYLNGQTPTAGRPSKRRSRAKSALQINICFAKTLITEVSVLASRRLQGMWRESTHRR